ncbi:MAG: dual OB domain-containing protein [Gammaproteobacteria bacterium]
MKYTKTIVCFANSRKTAGRCIAGKEWQGGKPGVWVRPVSARPTHEVSEEERRYEDGRNLQLLDIIEVPCDSHQPLPHQRENHVIDPGYYLVKQGKLIWKDIQVWLDSPNTLWGVGQGSYAGLNNRVAIGQEDGTSLYLISVERLGLLVGRKAPEYPDSKRAVRGEFSYRGTPYRMDVTDPVVERNYLNQVDGQYDILRPVLCISLGDPYQGYFYKLIAAVLYSERFA